MDQHRILIHLHTPKSGGATLRAIIHNQYQSDVVYDYGPAPESKTIFDNMSPEEKSQFKVIQGHMPFGMHEHLTRPATYITLLREPINRVISTYYFARHRPQHGRYVLAQKLSLREFVESGEVDLLDNGQTRLISGQPADYGACTPEMLEAAKANLTEHFGFVGLTERFDEGMIILKHFLGWRLPFYYRRNVGYSYPRKHELEPAVIAVIERYNELDIALYEFARNRFENLIRQQKHGFERAVKRYKQINSWYGKPFDWARRIKRIVKPK